VAAKPTPCNTKHEMTKGRDFSKGKKGKGPRKISDMVVKTAPVVITFNGFITLIRRMII